MQTLASLLEINVVQAAIDHLKIIVCRCTGSQCSSSPCRCNLSVKPRPRPRAPTMFWLIVPVRPGHLGLPVILHITHICPNKGALSQRCTRTYRYTEVRTLQVHMQVTHRPTHTVTGTHKDTQTKPLPMPSLMCDSNSCSGSQATLQGIHYYWCQNPQQEVMAEPPAVCTV